jgi:hypothetical protein
MTDRASGRRVEPTPLRRALFHPSLLLSAQAGLDGFLDRLEQIAPPAAREVAAQLGLNDPDPVEIVVLHAPAFAAWARGFAPEWGVGIAIWPHGPIVLDAAATAAGAKPLEVILRHELSHVYLGQRVAGARLPQWFVEGLAQRHASEWAWTDTFALVRAAALRRLPRLARLEWGFPAAGGAAQLAYALSMHAVGELERRLGPAGFAALLDDLRAGADFDAAMQRHAGTDVEGFDQEVTAALAGRFGWLGVLASLPNLFAVMTLLFLMAVARAYVRRRRRAAELEREEALLAPELPVAEAPDLPAATEDARREPRSTDKFSE